MENINLLNIVIIKTSTLDNASWDTAFESKCVDEVLDSLEKILNEILNRNIPLKTKRVKRQNQPAWMTTEDHESVKTRDKLLRRARKTNKKEGNHFSNAKYRTATIIKRSKQSFFCEKIDEKKGNPKGIWNALKT